MGHTRVVPWRIVQIKFARHTEQSDEMHTEMCFDQARTHMARLFRKPSVDETPYTQPNIFVLELPVLPNSQMG